LKLHFSNTQLYKENNRNIKGNQAFLGYKIKKKKKRKKREKCNLLYSGL